MVFFPAECQSAVLNTAENVIRKEILIYTQVCVNKGFVHSGLIGLIWGKHAHYVI